MIRGITFVGPNKWYPVLDIITNNIDIKKYSWFIVEKDVLKKHSDDSIDSYFNSDKYSGAAFAESIKDESCYAISINVQAFSNAKDFIRVHNYNDFLIKKCEIVILIEDNTLIYVYAKNKNHIEIIKNNAETNGFKNIEYITENHDYWIDY